MESLVVLMALELKSQAVPHLKVLTIEIEKYSKHGHSSSFK